MTQTALALEADDDNLAFIRRLKESKSMTWAELARVCEYSEDYVRCWFSPKTSDKFRPVPDRAVKIVKLKLEAGGVLI